MSEREAKDITDSMLEQVEDAVGMGCAAWDCVNPKAIVAAAMNLASRPAPVETCIHDSKDAVHIMTAAGYLLSIWCSECGATMNIDTKEWQLPRRPRRG